MGATTTSAPYARSRSIFSFDILSGITAITRYPFRAAAMASPVPVFPLVGSTIVPPGLSSPSRSAASTSAIAARSLMEPPGLSASTFATSCGVRSFPSRERRTSGVWPTASRIESFTSMLVPEAAFIAASTM